MKILLFVHFFKPLVFSSFLIFQKFGQKKNAAEVAGGVNIVFFKCLSIFLVVKLVYDM